ncbi:MAG: hypothetical protein EA379_00010 [Phycisphaerales bacterium]|nr:MAG: hypothetical protein EA379_00010 [Phycisphaerales bacterium]
MSSSRARRAVAAFSLAGLFVALAGCSAQEQRLASYRSNPTPEIDTRSQRPDDINNRLTITNDTNLRLFNEDLGRLFLMDRPSRLSRQRIPY